MAIMDGKKFDGIQLGKKLDKCCVCERALIQNPDREIPYLEYEEVFKVKIGGIDYCICMDHFKEGRKGDVLRHLLFSIKKKDCNIN